MKKHIGVLTVVAILCLFLIVRTVAAQGGVASYLVMIANQGTQISNQVQALTRMDTHIAQLTGQFQHLRDSALGQIGAIAQPIANLIAVPTNMLTGARAWHSDFTGPAAGMIAAVQDLSNGTSFSDGWRNLLQAADTVTVADIRNVYQSDPAAAANAVATYQRQRDYADRSLEYARARADAGADLIEIRDTTTGAMARIAARVDADPATGGPNRSSAALTEGDVLGSLAEIRTLNAIGRSRAAAATEDAAARFRQEALRRDMEARRLSDRAALEARWAQEQAIVAATAHERIQSMYGGYRIPAGLGGNPNP